VTKPLSLRDKPRRARFKTDFECDIAGGKTHATGHVRNLTIGGCRVLSPCAFPRGVTVSLVLPTAPHEPEFRIPAEIRWLGLNPDEGPFELGLRFVHTEDTTDRVERYLRTLMKQGTMPVVRSKRGAGESRRPGQLELVFASEGLDRILRPGLSAPLRGSPGAPRAGSGRS
jgi:hypothetical protein